MRPASADNGDSGGNVFERFDAVPVGRDGQEITRGSFPLVAPTHKIQLPAQDQQRGFARTVVFGEALAGAQRDHRLSQAALVATVDGL